MRLSTDEILAADEAYAPGARGMWAWRPVIDGRHVPGIPTDQIAAGAAGGVSLMAGTTLHESKMYVLLDEAILEEVQPQLRMIFGSEAGLVRSRYPSKMSDAEFGAAVITDERYTMPTIRLLEAQSAWAPTWRYRSDLEPPWYGILSGTHGGDMFFFLGRGLDADDGPLGLPGKWRDLSLGMGTALSRFAYGENPSGPGLPPWPNYGAPQRCTMILDTESSVVSDPDQTRRECWEGRTWESTPWWSL
jgi:para-nitrobenzyl esterase